MKQKPVKVRKPRSRITRKAPAAGLTPEPTPAPVVQVVQVVQVAQPEPVQPEPAPIVEPEPTPKPVKPKPGEKGYWDNPSGLPFNDPRLWHRVG